MVTFWRKCMSKLKILVPWEKGGMAMVYGLYIRHCMIMFTFAFILCGSNGWGIRIFGDEVIIKIVTIPEILSQKRHKGLVLNATTTTPCTH